MWTTIGGIVASLISAVASFFQTKKANTDKQDGIDEQSLADADKVNQEALDAKSTNTAVVNAPDGAAVSDLRANFTRD